MSVEHIPSDVRQAGTGAASDAFPTAARAPRPALPALALGVVALVAIAYANSLANDFAFDDVSIIQQNARVHQLRDLGQIWLTPYWPRFGPEAGLYRPLAIFGYALQWAVSGGSPLVFHVVNVLLHACVSVLALVLLARVVGPFAAFVGAALYAVHPVHTEVVANVVGQAEMLAAAGALAGCLIFAARPDVHRVSPPRLIALATCYGLAALAKESAIVIPALIVAWDIAERRLPARDLPRYLRAMIGPALVLALVAGAYLALRIHVLGTIGGTDPAPSMPFLREDPHARVLVGLRAWLEYARLLFFPMDLISDYGPAVVLPMDSITPAVLGGAGLLALTLLLAVLLPWRHDAGIVAFWFGAGVLPVSNLLFPVGVLVAERTLYLPSLAASFAVAYAADAAVRRGRVRATALVAGVVLALMAARTVIRNPDWKDTRTVQAALLRDHPESYRAQWTAAVDAFFRGDLATSERHWVLAYRLWPHDSQLLAEIANFHVARGQPELAIPLLETSHRMHPKVRRTEHLLGMAYLKAGRFPEALTAAERSARYVGPQWFLADIRGRALMALGRPLEAARAWRESIQLPEGDVWTQWLYLAEALSHAGEAREARAALDSARVRAVDDADALRQIEAAAARLPGGG